MKSTIVTSRRFVSTVVALVAMLIVAAVPEFAEIEAEFIDNVTAIIVALIAGYSVQDALLAWATGRNLGDESSESE